MRLFVYRDMLRFDYDELPDEDKARAEYNSARGNDDPPSYGVTLYFVEPDGPDEQRQLSDSFDVAQIFDLSTALLKIIPGKGHNEAVRGIQKWIDTASDIVQIFRNCISGGTGPARCLALAKQAGIRYRKQNALGLYKLLQMEQAFNEPERHPPQRQPREPPWDLYEAVRDHFVSEFAADPYFGQFIYERSEISEAEIRDDVEPKDFVFEVGELRTATFKYWGHYHRKTEKFKPIHIFPGFDVQSLFLLLRR